MTKAEIEAALKAAFQQCEAAICPLTDLQKQILLQVAEELIRTQERLSANSKADLEQPNPLDALTTEECQALLEFVKEQEKQNRDWKIALLNDWLNHQDSGSVQFIRDRFGFQWLNCVKPVHLAEYYDRINQESLKLKIGDRIEVSNSLWEWVPENDWQEWIPCTVIQVDEREESDRTYSTCIIRFDNGTEYEIQGIDDWNRYNWRWPLN